MKQSVVYNEKTVNMGFQSDALLAIRKHTYSSQAQLSAPRVARRFVTVCVCLRSMLLKRKVI